MDTVGSFGRTVADAVHGLNAIIGMDENDQMTCSPSRPERPDSEQLAEKSSEPNSLALRIVSRRMVVGTGSCHLQTSEQIVNFTRCREYKGRSAPAEAEITVAKVDAYNDINAYLFELSNTPMRSVEDIIDYNSVNTGTEGANVGDLPAFISGQVSPTPTSTDTARPFTNRTQNLFHEVAQTHGKEDTTYRHALTHTQTQCRAEGIDAALRYTTAGHQTHSFDALLLCDRLGSGQQKAAQAGKQPPLPSILQITYSSQTKAIQ